MRIEINTIKDQDNHYTIYRESDHTDKGWVSDHKNGCVYNWQLLFDMLDFGLDEKLFRKNIDIKNQWYILDMIFQHVKGLNDNV